LSKTGLTKVLILLTNKSINNYFLTFDKNLMINFDIFNKFFTFD